MEENGASTRFMNVVLGPGSEAQRHAPRPRQPSSGPPPATPSGGSAPSGVASGALAQGFQPQPSWNLTDFGGPTIAELTFVNRYVGGAAVWAAEDMSNIDRALASAMSDVALQTVIAQYYSAAITSSMLPSEVVEGAVPGTVYKDTAEALVKQLHDSGALGGADPAKSVINIMLPQGIVLSDDFSPGFQPPAGQEEAVARRKRSVIMIDENDAADSKHGLGGYHGSIHLADGSEVFYAVGVYSDGDNGIVAFDQPWKNVVATFYHELNEARTDADVEDVNATGNNGVLGWYSQTGQGEIGDLPINASGGNLSLVFKEIPLSDGSGTVPIQLMWSNRDDGPASHTGP